MNYEKEREKLFKRTGTIFAFSDEQFEEGKKEGAKYVSLGNGIFCQKEKVNSLVDGLKKIKEEEIKNKLKKTNRRDIIVKELWNCEAFYCDDGYFDAVDSLKEYGIKKDEIWKVYKEEQDKQ